VQLFTVADDWSEAALTWNNAPMARENVATTWVEVITTFPGWPGVSNLWDATQAVAEAYAAGKPANLALYSADTAYHSGKYLVSSDTGDWNAQGRPTLIVEWADEQRVPLHAGWNWLSFAVAPSGGTGVAATLASLSGQYDLVVGEVGTYAAPPALPGLNTLPSLEAGKGYMIRMKQPGELVLRGQRISAAIPLPLAIGWRWLGYLPVAGQDIPTALSSLAGKYDYVLGEAGTYAPPPSPPFLNTLSRLEPGRGYLVRMTQSGTLVHGPGG
jgi:hypothetical protein